METYIQRKKQILCNVTPCPFLNSYRRFGRSKFRHRQSQVLHPGRFKGNVVRLTKIDNLFILVINQLDAQNLFFNKFISCLYMFRAPCAHRQEVKIVLYSLWYHHTL